MVPGHRATGPVNLGRERDYRVPDTALVPRAAGDRPRVWIPRALLVAEVYSLGDETYDKFGHYHEHGVAEVIVVRADEHRVEVW